MIVIPQKDAESERSMIMSKLASEIQHLAKMHIIYRMFDPVTNNLFHRYFS